MAERPKYRPVPITAAHAGTAAKERSRYPDAEPPTRPATLRSAEPTPATSAPPARKAVRVKFQDDMQEFLQGITEEQAAKARRRREREVRRQILARRRQGNATTAARPVTFRGETMSADEASNRMSKF